MTLQFSTGYRNALLDAFETSVGVSAKLLIYTGTPPADCATAASGSLLATLSLPSDWMAAASGGSKAMSGTWSANASGTGTAGYYRITDSAGTTCHNQGTVGTSATDMIVDSTSFTTGQSFSVTAFTLTAPGA
jgi:hypothetical protein